jgi:hypothetical protein
LIDREFAYAFAALPFILIALVVWRKWFDVCIEFQFCSRYKGQDRNLSDDFWTIRTGLTCKSDD